MDSEKEKRASYENTSLPMETLQRKGHRNTMPPPVWTWSTRPSNDYAVHHYGSVKITPCFDTYTSGVPKWISSAAGRDGSCDAVVWLLSSTPTTKHPHPLTHPIIPTPSPDQDMEAPHFSLTLQSAIPLSLTLSSLTQSASPSAALQRARGDSTDTVPRRVSSVGTWPLMTMAVPLSLG
jgi:hypothetical protein